MPKLSFSVRIAAGSITLLSLAHILFWAFLAVSLGAEMPPASDSLDRYLVPILSLFAIAGLAGLLVAAGIFYARNWARVAALVLAALVGSFCAISVLVLFVLGSGAMSLGLGIEIPNSGELLRVGVVYLIIFAFAVWWVILFSRKSVAAQFSSPGRAVLDGASKKPACPPPIALLAWLMIISSALSAISWPLILGKIPVMLFTHIFALQPSRSIWIANVLLFAVCGIGLLKLQPWSYTGTIALHLFWLVSLLITQLSSNYETYTRICMDTLELADTYSVLNHIHVPQWISATMTALPTALLIAGLFYYRRSFLQAVQKSRRLNT